VSGEKVGHRSRPEVLVVVDEDNAGMTLLGGLAGKIEPAESADVSTAVMDGYREARRPDRSIDSAAIRAVVPDQRLHGDILHGKLP
jgi:hypothetical protein